MRIARGWIVTGRSKCVSLLTYAHACSQACSQGQVYRHQGVMSFCEVCEAIFLLFLKMKKILGRGVCSAIKTGRCEDRDFSLTLLTSLRRVLGRGACGEGRARRSLSVILGSFFLDVGVGKIKVKKAYFKHKIGVNRGK